MKRSNGVTLVELMIVVAIMGIITPVLVTLVTTITSGFTGYEAAISMRKINQQSLDRIYLRLGSCKRIFQNTANDQTYRNAISFTSSPAVAAGVQLPLINSAGTLAAGTTNFPASSVGNALLFANNEMVQAMNSTSSRVDVYRFNYYYLTSVNTSVIDSGASYKLVEWRSVAYADINQLYNIAGTTRTAVATQLYNCGVKCAWDPTSATVTNAFYNISAAGAITANGASTITEYLNKYKILTNITTGIIIGGYRYGVSRNNSGWAKAPKNVPLYGTANGTFPGGFEVAIAGSNAGRQVLLRCVLVAQGSMKAIVGDDLQVVACARDLW